MAAPAWFVEHLEELRRLPGSRPASARTLAEWATQVGDGDAPSRPTISRWISGSTLPTSFEPLEVLVSAVRERTRIPTRQARETLLRSGWWREVYERALTESGRGDSTNGHRTPVVYQGMDPFGRGDAARFFGRGRAIEAVRDRLDVLWTSRSGTPLVVLGPSGVGKSSLLAAGVLPALEAHGLPSAPEVAGWPSTIISPGAHPLRALSTAREALAGETSRSGAGAAAVVFVVDQFEEIFQAGQEVQERFVAELLELADPRSTAPPVEGSGQDDERGDREPRVAAVAALVVLVCRNDFYPELRQTPGLGSALDRPFNLDPLTGEELTEAILKPARQAGISVGHDLVTRLVADAGVSAGGTVAGQLPLISHVLRVMNQAGPMTVRAYERVGGIAGAVAYTATQAWEALRRSGLEATALALLVRLVRVGDYPGHDARRQLDREELLAPGEGNETEQALRILSVARLVTSSQDTVQITHEALLRSWDRLRDTIDTQRADLVLRQNVELRARQWDDAGRPPEQLLRGTVLTAAHRVTDNSPAVGTTDLSREFLTRADTQERQLATRSRRLRFAAIAAVVLIIAAGTVAVVEGVAEYRVNQRVVLAEVLAQARAAQQNDPSLAAQLYLTAYRMRPDPSLYTALLDTENQPLSQPLHGHDGIVRAVVHVGSGVASAGDDGTVRLWADRLGNVDPEATTLTEPGSVTGLAAIAGRPMLISSEDGALPSQSTLRVWDATDPHRPLAVTGELPAGAGHLTGLSTSPDGKLLAATASDGTVRLWNINDPSRPADLGVRVPGATHSVYGAAAVVSPDGHTLAVAGDVGTIELFDISDPVHPAPLLALPSGTELTHSVAFSPTGNLLVSAGANGALRLWDTSNPAGSRLLAQPPSVSGAAFLTAAVSPDGNTLAAAASNNTVTLWNISDPARPIPLGQPLSGDTRGDGTLEFGPDGHTLITGSGDGTVRVWSLPATRLASAGTVGDVAFSHSGRTLAVGDAANRSVSLWDTTDPSAPVPLVPSLPQGGQPGPDGFHLGFSADDRVLAASGGQTVRLWDVRDPRHPFQLGSDLILPSAVGGMEVSPDGRTLAVGGADGLSRLFNIADPSRPIPLDVSLRSTPGKLVGVTRFSPDGRTLATSGEDFRIWLWDTSDPALPHLLGAPLTGHFDTVFGIAFSPDGQRLVSVSTDHTTRVWDVSDRTHARPVGPSIVRQGDVVGAADYSADGARLATGSNDRTVALWNTEDPNRPAPIGSPLSGHTAKIYSVQFRPGGQVLASGGADRTAMLWNLDINAAIHRLCATTPGTLTPQAWSTLVSPDETYDPPCGAGDPVGDH